MRKFVYYQVLEKFQQLDPANIELAYRKKDKNGKNEKENISLGGNGHLTIDNMLDQGFWSRSKCDLNHKEKNHIQIGDPKFNETLYVRFIQA